MDISQQSMDGKVAFITGASSGIGEGVAIKFSKLGCSVVLNGRNEQNLKRVSALCTEQGLPPGKVLIAKADVSSDAEVKKAIDLAIQTFGQLDILVNNAGIVRYGTIEDCDMAQYDEIMDNNLRSAVLVTKYAVPHLIKSKGCIVNVSSISGISSYEGELFYALSKAAMDQLTKCTAMELASKGVRVNSVNPGVVNTNIHVRAGFSESKHKQYLEEQKSVHPLGRCGHVDDTSDAILFFASPASSWITGALLPVDGGRTRLAPNASKL